MNLKDIVQLRLSNQRITENLFERPEEVVSWFGAIQAQDYSAAKWAIALRSNSLSNSCLDQAFAEGKILRTHVLRPTWHFVAPTDIRWMLQLSAQRVNEQMTHWYHSAGLTSNAFKKANAVITKVLQGGKQLKRTEIASELKKSNLGIALNNLTLTFIMLHAELDGVVCSGALKGKQQTYSLLDERAPKTRKLTHDEALAKLTKRYFESHGPATIKDYSWWSSLSVVDARRGIDMVSSELTHETITKQDYWFVNPDRKPSSKAAILLLPNFDEYIIGYTDRTAIFDESFASGLDARHNPLFQNTILIDGQIMGTWKRTIQKSNAIVVAKPFIKLSNPKQELLEKAVLRYSKFLEVPSELVIESFGAVTGI